MSRIEKLIQDMCPDGAEFVTLEDVARTVSGLTGKTKADFSDGNARYVTYKNAFSNLAVDDVATDFVKVEDGERQNSLRLGDVVITGSSENVDEVGMSSVVIREPMEPLYLNSFCFALRFDYPTLLPEFSKYLFRGEAIRKQIRKSASGVTRINVSKPRFMKVRIPVPPLEVQREIVRVLDKFTQLEAELEAELEARRAQYDYYFNDLLSFGADEAQEFTLGDIGRVAMCKRVFKSETRDSGGVPFYKIGTFGGHPDAYISRDLFDSYREKFSFPSPGDVLISAAGTIGRTVVYDGEAAYFQDSNIVWLDHDESIVTNAYLKHWYKVIEWTTDGGTIRRLYNSNLLRARILVPPFAEQDRIAKMLDKFDALVNDINIGLPAELAARRKQYEHYRDRLLAFKELAS